MFKVPNPARITTGVMWSSEADGNNGVFQFKKNNVIFKCVASDGAGWEHVSVTLKENRTPTWEEMCFVKKVFWDQEDTVIQYHPAKKDYVNRHPHCLHLWRPKRTSGILPIPPKEFVG